jgi:hypothetical protein
VREDIKLKLEAESELESITLNTLVGKILTKYVEWDSFAEDSGFVFVTKNFVKSLLTEVPNKTIENIGKTTCKSSLRDAILYLHGEVDDHTFIDTLDKWLSASHIPFRKIEKNEKKKYIIQHDLGHKWSLYFSTLISSIIVEIGYSLDNQILDEQLISFEFNKSDK